jgi:hypothetical protein
MSVFVIDKRKEPLMPCSEKRARKLLVSGLARVHRLIPFSIPLVDRYVSECELQLLILKIDPGSKTTGIALVRESESASQDTGEITTVTHLVSLMELTHRGGQISEALTARSQERRRRRGNLRYRKARFSNRGNKGRGWLAPSLQHRVDTTLAWIVRLMRLAPLAAIAQELLRLVMQLMEKPEIGGAEFQRRVGRLRNPGIFS